MSNVGLAIHQFRYDQKIFWRNPAAVFFTVMLPVIFLLIFATMFGNDTIAELGGIKVSTYYVPGIVTLAVVSATLVNVAMRMVEAREGGRLKRVRGTPLPAWAFIAGRVGNAVVVAVIMVVIVTVIGRVIYGVEVPTTTLPALVVALAIGSFTFCCLGFALTALIPSEDAAPPITNFTVLPLYFLSGVFIPKTEIPDGVLDFAGFFPIRHFFEAVLTAYNPATDGAGFEWGHLAIVAIWGLAGLAIAIRTFSFVPRDG